MSREIPDKWRQLFALIPGYDPVGTAGEGQWFDAEQADLACEFFETMLTHIEGSLAGKPLHLEPWQRAIVGCVFGWKRADGTRRYREVFQFVPRKNGKSTMVGGLINYVGFCDGEPGAQIYSAAAEKEQAALVYRQAKGMILNNPVLADGVKIHQTFKSMEFPGGSIYKALSAEADTKHGFNGHFIVIDELHAQPNRDLVDVLMTSTGSRTQPLVWHITTSDFERESICNEKHDYASKVRDGIIDDSSFLPVIYEASREDDWKSEATWRKANPNLGVSVSLEYLTRECKRAQDVPAYENTFKRLHLNMRTEQDQRVIPMDKWDACGGAFDAVAELSGRSCYAGLDLSATSDFTALVLWFPDEDGQGGYALPYFWLPRHPRRRDKRMQDQIDAWAREGLIGRTAGDVVDYQAVKAKVLEIHGLYPFTELAIDRRFQGAQLCTDFMEAGLNVIDFGQGWNEMAAPSKALLEMVMAGRLRHGGNKVLRWMASNATAEFDGDAFKFSKKKSTEKIDGVVSLAMAIGRAQSSPPPVGFDFAIV